MNPSGLLPLIKGYQTFRNHYFQSKPPLFPEPLRHGQQNPQFFVIACSDSRVDPALVFNCQPGEIFAVRNIANLVLPYTPKAYADSTAAALEFGVCVLNIPHIIVLGHTQCRGIEGLCLPHTVPPTLGGLRSWIEAMRMPDHILDCSTTTLPGQTALLCNKKYLKRSFNNLSTFPWIAQRLATQTLFLHALLFHVETGNLQYYDAFTDSFQNILHP